MIRPEVQLDNVTGRLTYSLHNISARPFDISLYSIDCRPVIKEGAAEALLSLFFIEIDKEVYGLDEQLAQANEELESALLELAVNMRTDNPNEGPTIRNIARVVNEHRAVTLLPNEGVSCSMVMQDQVWFNDVLRLLEESGYEHFHVSPKLFLFVPDGKGGVRLDEEQTGLTNSAAEEIVEPAGGERRWRYRDAGAKVTLAALRRLQEVKARPSALGPGSGMP